MSAWFDAWWEQQREENRRSLDYVERVFRRWGPGEK